MMTVAFVVAFSFYLGIGGLWAYRVVSQPPPDPPNKIVNFLLVFLLWPLILLVLLFFFVMIGPSVGNGEQDKPKKPPTP
ncbi:MAG: hypothetical protein AAB692_04255 [Patescibacteria group bacterium]